MDALKKKVKILQNLKEKIIEFLDQLYQLLPTERDLISLRLMFMDQIPMEDAMEIMINRVYPHAAMIESRNEKFFLECTDIFEGIGEHKVSYFKQLWQSPQLDEQDKEDLWVWFNYFLKMVRKYQAAE